MHIPDGFLDTKTIVATSLFSLAGLGKALRSLSREMTSRKIPLMGLAAAFVFVAQMLNFPVVGGTSGHLLGAVLISVLAGMNAGIVIISLILVVQAFLFADGGILALGANIFNMAIVGSVIGTAMYRGIRLIAPGRWGFYVGVAAAAWCSTVVAAICCAGQLAWSGTVAWGIGFPAMAGIHMLIGIGEAVITAIVLAAVTATRPDLLSGRGPEDGNAAPLKPLGNAVVYGAIVVAGLALFVSPFSSRWPDGLEKVAARFGFDTARLSAPLMASPLAEYRMPGIGLVSVSTALAGTVGAAVVSVAAVIVVRAISRKSAKTS